MNKIKKLVLWIVFFIVSQANAVAPEGLVYHWNFDEGPDWHDDEFQQICELTQSADVISNANVTLKNMSSDNWVSGQQFTAINFDGVNDYLEISTDIAPVLGKTSSLIFWIKTSLKSEVNSLLEFPAITGSKTGENDIQFGVIDENGNIGITADNKFLIKSEKNIADNLWHHIIFTRDSATGYVQLFIDGKIAQSATALTGERTKSFTTLGCLSEGENQSNFFTGRVDQVYIFNRVISADEAVTLKKNYAPKTWNLKTIGNTEAFTTESIFSRVYDVERDEVSIHSFTQPQFGSVSHNGDGSFLFTPIVTTHSYKDRFEVTVEDGKGGFHTSFMDISVVKSNGDGTNVTTFTDFEWLKINDTELSLNGFRVPRAIDWNEDGLMDFLVSHNGSIIFYENIGTKTTPIFSSGVFLSNKDGGKITSSSSSSLSYIDIDNDGKKELLFSQNDQKIAVCKNLAEVGEMPILDSVIINIYNPDNTTPFILQDVRFDFGDWNNDGLVDLVTGVGSGDMKCFLNKGTAEKPIYDKNDFSVILSGSYNFYPRFCDLDDNGVADFIRTNNWGAIDCWKNVSENGLSNGFAVTIIEKAGNRLEVKPPTNGAIIDFSDFNGDGILDIIVGGHNEGKIGLGFGEKKDFKKAIAEIEFFYDKYPDKIGLEMGKDASIMNKIKAANEIIVDYVKNGTYSTRKELYADLTAHIKKYSFLKYQTFNTTHKPLPDKKMDSSECEWHNIPGIILQNWTFLQYLLPDTPTKRNEIADTLGLEGMARTIYIENGFALGDNAKSLPVTYGTIRDFMLRLPSELFPDSLMTYDQLYEEGRDGYFWTPNSNKNTFGQWAIGSANEWAGDLTRAIEKVLGVGKATGDYFTFVMGHEVTHSLDNYVRTRGNKDLSRRWGMYVTTAGGPDLVPEKTGNNGWWDVTATKQNFIEKGYWDGKSAWNNIVENGVIVENGAWEKYWSDGPGKLFNGLSVMRLSVQFFLTTRQESLATQANHHWANARGRLIGATDRFRRAGELGIGYEPLRANINEVVHFIDFQSAGMNTLNLVETKTESDKSKVNWYDFIADLERNDLGLITKIHVDGITYDFTYDEAYVVNNVTSTYLLPENENIWTKQNESVIFDVTTNDKTYDGGKVRLVEISAPTNGHSEITKDGKISFTPSNNFVGTVSFSYKIAPLNEEYSNFATATCYIDVLSLTSYENNIIIDYWDGINGNSINDLKQAVDYPANSTSNIGLNGDYELPTHGTNYGARVRSLLVPITTGNYNFWICAGGPAELYLSSDENPINKSLIASLDIGQNAKNWTAKSAQKSKLIFLEAGKSYYIESIFKQSGANDNHAVAWNGPFPEYGKENVIGKNYLANPFTVAKTFNIYTATVLNENVSFSELSWDPIIEDFSSIEDKSIFKIISSLENVNLKLNGTVSFESLILESTGTFNISKDSNSVIDILNFDLLKGDYILGLTSPNVTIYTSTNAVFLNGVTPTNLKNFGSVEFQTPISGGINIPSIGKWIWSNGGEMSSMMSWDANAEFSFAGDKKFTFITSNLENSQGAKKLTQNFSAPIIIPKRWRLGLGTTNILEGAEITADGFISGDGGGNNNSTINQTGGTFNLTGDLNANNTSDAIVMAHWNSNNFYNLSGGNLIAEKAVAMLSRDGAQSFTISGKGFAKFKGLRFKSTGNARVATLNLNHGGTLSVGSAGIITANSNATSFNFNGGTLKAHDNFSVNIGTPIKIDCGSAKLDPTENSSIASIIDLNNYAVSIADKLTDLDTENKKTGSLKIIDSSSEKKGVLTLGGDNDFTGGVKISGSAVKITHQNALGSVLGSFVTIEDNGTCDFSDLPDNAEIPNMIWGDGGHLILSGEKTVILNNPSHLFAGLSININVDKLTNGTYTIFKSGTQKFEKHFFKGFDLQKKNMRFLYEINVETKGELRLDVTKIDLKATPENLQEMLDFIKNNDAEKLTITAGDYSDLEEIIFQPKILTTIIAEENVIFPNIRIESLCILARFVLSDLSITANTTTYFFRSTVVNCLLVNPKNIQALSTIFYKTPAAAEITNKECSASESFVGAIGALDLHGNITLDADNEAKYGPKLNEKLSPKTGSVLINRGKGL